MDRAQRRVMDVACQLRTDAEEVRAQTLRIRAENAGIRRRTAVLRARADVVRLGRASAGRAGPIPQDPAVAPVLGVAAAR